MNMCFEQLCHPQCLNNISDTTLNTVNTVDSFVNQHRNTHIVFGTSELCDEGDHVVFLENLVQFGLHVLVHVGLKRVLQQDPACRQDVVKPVRHVEHRPTCRSRQHRPKVKTQTDLKNSFNASCATLTVYNAFSSGRKVWGRKVAAGLSKHCIAGSWTCFSFSKTYHRSSKKLLQFWLTNWREVVSFKPWTGVSFQSLQSHVWLTRLQQVDKSNIQCTYALLPPMKVFDW